MSNPAETAPPAAPTAETGDPTEGLGQVLSFMRLLWALDHALQSASKRMKAKVGVTGPQRVAIRVLGRFPAISAGRLAEILHVHPSTLTGVLQRLVERGLVDRKEDAQDRRRALFSLTGEGRQLDRVRAGTVEASVRKVLAQLPPEQVAAAQTVLSALADGLDQGD